MDNTKGRIRNYELYAQGKMLDHSGWYGLLRRGITPSDMDGILDFNGTILFIEFKHKSPFIHDLPKGQLILMKHLVQNGQGRQIAVCAQINTPADKEVDTLRDVVAFQFMTTEGVSDVIGGERWKEYVVSVDRGTLFTC